MAEEEEGEGGRSCFQFKQRDIYSGVQLHGRRSIRCPGEDFEPFPWTTSQPCPSWIKGRRVLIIRLQFHVGFILDWERDSHLNFNGHGM